MMPLRYALILVVAALCLSLPFVISEYLGQGAQWLDMPSEATIDPSSLAAFEDGYRSEREGDLAGALAKYRIAESSKAAAIKEAGTRAAERVNARLNSLGPAYDGLRTLSEWSRALFFPLVLTGLFILLVIITSLITRRSGTEIRRFIVIPEGETQYSLQFDRLLNEEIARIARGFRTDQLRRIGAAITMSAPTEDSELAGLETRALEAMRQGELKSIIGFWLSEVVRRFRNIGFRPEYVVAGTVVVRTDEAKASAQLARAGRHSRIAILGASSAEIGASEISLPSQAALPAAADTADLTADPPEDAQHLADLATVLACKFFIAWLEMEATKPTGISRSPETMPASWQTVYDYISALSAIEASR